jgi:ubiquinone/menaquinone biosynthesis C-methylase UbiE
LKSLGFNTTGVDINPKMIEFAGNSDKTGEYLPILNDKIPFADVVFDLVFSSFVLLEMSSLQEIEKALIEINRVLKPGGHFVAVLNNENMYKHQWNEVNTNFPQNKNLKSGDKVKIELLDKALTIEDYYWTQDDYINVMQKANLEILEINSHIEGLKSETNRKDEINTSPISIYFSKKT